MLSDTGQCKQLPPVDMMINDINRELSGLEEAINETEKKFMPILIQPQPSGAPILDCNKKERTESGSRICLELAEIARRVTRSTRNLYDICERSEV